MYVHKLGVVRVEYRIYVCVLDISKVKEYIPMERYSNNKWIDGGQTGKQAGRQIYKNISLNSELITSRRN